MQRNATSLIRREMKIKITMRYYFAHERIAINKKKYKNSCRQGSRELKNSYAVD